MLRLSIRKGFYPVVLVIGLLTCMVSHAGRGVMNNNFHADNYNERPDYNNNYNNNDRLWISPGAVYVNPTSCSTVQQCDDEGNCSQTQVCN